MAKTTKTKKSKATKKTVKKTAAKKTGQKSGTTKPTSAAHSAVFASLAARSTAHSKSPVCYQRLTSGAWLVCFLQGDGSYGQCQPYDGPIHTPECG